MKWLIQFFRTMTVIVRHPMARRHRVSSIIRFMRFQVGILLVGGRATIPWVDDAVLHVGWGEAGISGNAYSGLFEFDDMGFLLHALDSGDVFIDVGANAGAYSVLASAVVKSRSVSFEPVPQTFQRLETQIKVNNTESRVRLVNKGVGDMVGRVRMTVGRDAMNRVVESGSPDDSVEVSICTLDTELSESGTCAMKVDVEGFEYNVLVGATKLLSSGRVKFIIIEMNGNSGVYQRSDAEVHELITSHGYVPVSYDPWTRTVRLQDEYDREGGNTLYVRDVESIQRACASAPHRVVHTGGGVSV